MKRQISIISLIRLIGLIGLIGAAYSGGYLHGHRNLEFEKGIKPKIVNLELGKPTEVDFSLFWDAYDVIQQKSFNRLDNEQAVYGAIAGMIQSLRDPFSAFLDPTEAKLFTQDLKGEFGGIGAELAHKEGRLLVVSPIEDTPAAKAGLKPKDEIIKIDGEDVSTLSFGEAIVKIRGEKGTKVVLTIAREGEQKPLDIAIIRGTISVKSISFKQEGEIGILRLNQFGEDTTEAIRKLEGKIKSLKGLVVDVRNNPGGLLDSAIDVTSLFDPGSPILIEEEKEGKRNNYERTLNPIFSDVKLVVLINEGSASASEILAGALQDHGRAKLVGVKSFGKGSVQNLESLKDDSLVRITVAKWLTPSGRQINGTGIEPDINVAHNAQKDDQMAKAIEILTTTESSTE